MQERSLEWGQGSVLNECSAKHLGLIKEHQHGSLPVIITHDCDLRHQNEDTIELIIGDQLENLDPNYMNAKNPRRLHLEFLSDERKSIYLDMRFSNRDFISKEKLVQLKQNKSVLEIPHESKKVLKQWLAARYGRPAFPNSFEYCLRKTKRRKTVEYHLAKIFEPIEPYIVGLYFDLGEQMLKELKENPYELNIYVIYNGKTHSSEAHNAALKAAQEVELLFSDVYGTSENAKGIRLGSCKVISDTKIALSDVRTMEQWRLEYLSIGEKSSEVYFQTGEV